MGILYYIQIPLLRTSLNHVLKQAHSWVGGDTHSLLRSLLPCYPLQWYLVDSKCWINTDHGLVSVNGMTVLIWKHFLSLIPLKIGHWFPTPCCWLIDWHWFLVTSWFHPFPFWISLSMTDFLRETNRQMTYAQWAHHYLLAICWPWHPAKRLLVVQSLSRLTLGNPMDHAWHPCPSLSPEFAHIHIHWVSDAIQPSHPLLPSSPPAINPSQHQDLFQWVTSLHQVAKVLELLINHEKS